MGRIYIIASWAIIFLALVAYVVAQFVQPLFPNNALTLVPPIHALVWIMIGILMRVDSAIRSV